MEIGIYTNDCCKQPFEEKGAEINFYTDSFQAYVCETTLDLQSVVFSSSFASISTLHFYATYHILFCSVFLFAYPSVYIFEEDLRLIHFVVLGPR